MALQRYGEKRKFASTPEPRPRRKRAAKRDAPRFVVHKHHARRMHYDLRLEYRGVLKSWAVPKGPSMNPADKRLAIHTEDHPYDYKDFEGVIPEGNYGAGSVIVWDEGGYELQTPKGFDAGHIDFILQGEKLRGAFSLIRTQGDQWLLIKQHDASATASNVLENSRSVRTRKSTEDLEGVKAAIPTHVRPMLAVTADAPFNRDGWVFELKWDGYRAIAETGKDVRLYSRTSKSFLPQFAPIAEALRALPRDLVLDGEVVMLDDEGVSRFQLLQRYLETGEAEGRLMYVVFDLLYHDGLDIRRLPLRERKRLLKEIIPAKHPRLRYSDHIEGRGESLYALAEDKGLEGIIAKDGESRYWEGRRASDWLKIRTHKRQEAVIGGFTQGRESRKHFGALLLGVYDHGKLVPVGHVGTGFDDVTLASLRKRMDRLVTDRMPFAQDPAANMPPTWVQPKLVAEVAFQEWTRDGHLRKPVFLGLREDKLPHDVHREELQTIAFAPTNVDKVFWPEDGYTKGDLIAYYRRVAPYILPYLKGRPESLLRHPNGIHGESFYQKHVDETLPPAAETVVIPSESGKRDVRYLVCNNVTTLAFLANFGCIELNPWSSKVENLTRPDYAIFDLDPNDVSFDDVITTARMVRTVLDDLGVPSYCKTSGKSGLHVFVPLSAQYTYDVARRFTELVCRMVHRRLPKLTTMERRLNRRPKAVYLDYLQNKEGATLAAAYCVRPVPGAPVSTPLRWSEVKKGLDPGKFTIKTIMRRLARVGDLWQPVLGEGVDLLNVLKKNTPAG